MENVHIQIRNYQYNDRQIRKIERKMEFLQKRIPCNSRVLLDFEYENKLFSGKLKLDFDGNSFCATDRHAVLGPLTGQLCKKAHKQVMKWKKSRTVEDITGIIPLNRHRPKSMGGWNLPPLSRKAG